MQARREMVGTAKARVELSENLLLYASTALGGIFLPEFLAILVSLTLLEYYALNYTTNVIVGSQEASLEKIFQSPVVDIFRHKAHLWPVSSLSSFGRRLLQDRQPLLQP